MRMMSTNTLGAVSPDAVVTNSTLTVRQVYELYLQGRLVTGNTFFNASNAHDMEESMRKYGYVSDPAQARSLRDPGSFHKDDVGLLDFKEVQLDPQTASQCQACGPKAPGAFVRAAPYRSLPGLTEYVGEAPSPTPGVLPEGYSEPARPSMVSPSEPEAPAVGGAGPLGRVAGALGVLSLPSMFFQFYRFTHDPFYRFQFMHPGGSYEKPLPDGSAIYNDRGGGSWIVHPDGNAEPLA